MKKIFIISAAASLFFAACNSPEKDLDTKKDVIITDTTGMYQSNGSTDVAKGQETVAPAKPEVKTITKVIYVDRTPKVRHQNQTVRQATAVQNQPVTNVPPVNNTGNSNTANTSTTDNHNSGEGSAGTQTSNGNGNNNDMGTGTTIPEKKKGWSNAAKDATIGGVGGAVVGAVIGRNKGKSAVIGGILGGVGGYILGNKKEKAAKKDLADF